MAVDYIPPELDPKTREAIDAIHKRTMAETPDSLAASAMEGVSDSRGFLGGDKASMVKEQKFGVDQNTLAAIQRRSERQYDNALHDLGIREKINAPNRSFERKQRAAELLQKEHDYNENIRMMKAKAEANKRAARAQTLGAILGIAGAVAGGVISGGNPMGAMAGYAAGQGVGNMADSGGEG
jgi:predicted transcriptional regulator